MSMPLMIDVDKALMMTDADKIEYLKGAVDFRNRIIENLRGQLEEAHAQNVELLHKIDRDSQFAN